MGILPKKGLHDWVLRDRVCWSWYCFASSQKVSCCFWTQMRRVFENHPICSVPFIPSRGKPSRGHEIYASSGKRINGRWYLYLYRAELRNRPWNLYQVFLNGIGVCISDGSVDLNLSENQRNWKMFVLTHLPTKETVTNTVGGYSYLLTHYVFSPKMSPETGGMEMNENQQWSWNTQTKQKPQLQKTARSFKAQQAVDSNLCKVESVYSLVRPRVF